MGECLAQIALFANVPYTSRITHNYHKLDRRALEKLTYVYLGDWITRQKAAVPAGEEGSDAKFAAAQELKAALENILEGESPYDIFVRWKPLEKQPIGWDPDLNDGVHLNIRPFMLAQDMGKKGPACCGPSPKSNGKRIAARMSPVPRGSRFSKASGSMTTT